MSESGLKARLTAAMTAALRGGEKRRLGCIRLILAEIKRLEVDERATLDDARILAVLDRMSKQRRDSRQQFLAANRQDLAAQEQFELDTIAEFLPAALSASELDALINQAIATTAAQSVRDLGKIMAVLKPQIQGRADPAAVSQLIRARWG